MNSSKLLYDVIVVGGGAAGLMAAMTAGKRGKKVLLIEHTGEVGQKIKISGGGRCNFTNIGTSYHNYLSKNIDFIKSALANYSQHDFIKLVEQYQIAYHEKTLGQLFCDGSSQQIINMLLSENAKSHVKIIKNCHILDIEYTTNFALITEQANFYATKLIIACGGLSIPKIGASDFGYKIAKKFGLKIIPPRPALVPLTVSKEQLARFSAISGISNSAIVTYQDTSFKENILFTHKGLSGPAILQISSYLEQFNNQEISINLLPERDLEQQLLNDKNSKQILANYLKTLLPSRLVELIGSSIDLNGKITEIKKSHLQAVSHFIHHFRVTIAGNEGFQKAEVTAGGVDTDLLSSKTMACQKIPNLYFIGEVVDVTGWLGGYNFQWAWSSGFAAGSDC